MMTDTIADMLTRIRNAAYARHERVIIPFSRLKLALAGILVREGFLESAEEGVEGGKSAIIVRLKYDAAGKSAITAIKRVSTPGRRLYRKRNELPHVLNEYGIAVVSTPRGLMTNREARQKGMGGEIICEVY
ncbi:MAG: 30S ribosomal protein S8 [Parcubacteria group bacterium]|nr:30S ribosomal protein S8 [Parcubacteria group bacterium]